MSLDDILKRLQKTKKSKSEKFFNKEYVEAKEKLDQEFQSLDEILNKLELEQLVNLTFKGQ